MMLKLDKRSFFCLFFSAVLVLCSAASIPAETRYVSDQLIISIRDGQTPEDQIIGYLISDTPVEVLEETQTHFRVKTVDGLEGWVKAKYLLTTLPKKAVIEELKTRITELEAENEAIRSQDPTSSLDDYATAKKKYELKIKHLTSMLEKESQATASTVKELKTLRARNKDLQGKYDALSQQHADLSEKSGNATTLKQEIKTLKQTNTALDKEIENLKNKQQTPFLSGNIKWFLSGSGVLLFGIILGRLAHRKRSYPY